MIKAVIFDCFGVVFTDTFVDCYEFFGGDYAADEQWVGDLFYAVFSGKLESSTPAIAKRLGISEGVWAEKVAKGRDFNYPLLEFIDELRKKYKIAMLSNVNSKGLEA